MTSKEHVYISTQWSTRCFLHRFVDESSVARSHGVFISLGSITPNHCGWELPAPRIPPGEYQNTGPKGHHCLIDDRTR